MEMKQVVIDSNKEKIVLSIWEGEKNLPALIFLPGTMANPYTYISFINEMKKYNMTIVGINFTNHGRSKRYSKKEAFTITDLYINTIDTINYVKENIECSKIALFGHSQGGIIATMCINNTEYVDKFILGDTVISNQTKLYKIMKLPKISRYFAFLFKMYFKIIAFFNPLKKLKFSDYIKVDKDQEESDEIKYKDDELRVNSYPLSMVSSIINVDTTNAVKKECDKEIYLIAVKEDEIFPLDQQIEAFNLINAKKKEFIEIDFNQHMVYTEKPIETSKIIYNICNK